MPLGRIISPYDKIPSGHGIAYHCFDVHGSMAYPVPINLFVRWARNFHLWLMCAPRPSWADKRFMAMYQLGEKAANKRYQDRIDRMARIEKIMDEILARR